MSMGQRHAILYGRNVKRGAVGDAEKLEALYSVFGGTSALFHRVGALIGRVHPLDDMGPRTMPRMARARPVSHQYVRCSDEGRVEIAGNPAHERSGLVRSAPRDRDLVEEIGRRDAELLGKPEVYIPEEDPRVAAGILRSPRGILCGERAEERRRPKREA